MAFTCSCCARLIGEGGAVYMRHDQWYCSPRCRDDGLLRPLATEPRVLGERRSRVSCGSLAASSRARSDTTLSASLGSQADVLKAHCAGHAQGGLVRDLLAWVGQRLVDVVLQRVASCAWGEQALRTYSSGVLLGSEFTKGSSVQLLLNYFPEVDHFVKRSESWISERSDLSVPLAEVH
mmetsp:Transcript_9166/g.24137  ORF Transcript_9166/g.24137 Transcript_9166/m.24137 type:complete len:179 (-) Transcript_9166:151-687(-)